MKILLNAVATFMGSSAFWFFDKAYGVQIFEWVRARLPTGLLPDSVLDGTLFWAPLLTLMAGIPLAVTKLINQYEKPRWISLADVAATAVEDAQGHWIDGWLSFGNASPAEKCRRFARLLINEGNVYACIPGSSKPMPIRSTETDPFEAAYDESSRLVIVDNVIVGHIKFVDPVMEPRAAKQDIRKILKRLASTLS